MNEFENYSDRMLDSLLDKALRQEPPEGLEERLSALIDNCAAQERRKSLRRVTVAITSIAATALIVIGLYFKTMPANGHVDTFSDPDEAAVAVQQMLAYMSEELNKGIEQVEIIDSKFEQVNTVINNSFNH